MKVGIDLRHITVATSGGIAPLLKGVLEAWFALGPEDEFVVFCTIFNRSLLDLPPGRGRAITLPTYRFMAEVDRIAAEERLDVLFRGYPAEEGPSFPAARQVVLIPDIQHEAFPEFFEPEVLRARRAAFGRALRQAGAIGTISEHARRSLADHAGRGSRDIFLMPPALPVRRADADEPPLSAGELALVPDGDFFLYPANLWKHKNHRRTLQAFDRFLRETGRRAQLILTGHPAGWPELQADFRSLPVRHLGFVRPQLLRLLLARARALTFFSLYEGFGMPLLEAFEAGTPVIASNSTSLPEVGGDAILTCDPTDVAAMSGLMATILADSALAAGLAARGRRRLAAYSWERSARSLREACRRVAGPAPAAVARPPAAPRPPLVTIVTPSFNQGRFLGRTIDSVLAQSYPRIEYIVMDGGSRDESVEILKSYGNRFVWTSEPDGGQTDAINKGFARSSGDIRGYLNSDDTLAPGAIERVVAFFRDHPEADLVYGTADYIDEQDRVIGRYRTEPYSFPALMRDCIVCQPAAFWRTAIAQRIGPFNESLNFAMDYEYWLRIARAGGVIEHIPDTLAFSRLYPETKTLSARGKIYDEIFRVCAAQGGYVDRDFFLGYWHHLCWERPTGWPRRLRRIPRFYRTMAHLHHLWFNRGRHPVRALLRRGARAARGRMARLLAGTPRLHRLARRLLLAIRGQRHDVWGYWGDNWLEPLVRIRLRPRPPGHRYHLAGSAPVDLELRITCGDAVVGRHALKAHEPRRVTLSADGLTGPIVSLRFSKGVTDAAGRRLSFLVEDTNLFAEEDLA